MVSRLLAALQVKKRDDVYEQATHRWGNRDIWPIPPIERTYSALDYYAYWGTCGISLSSYTIGSSLIGYGLTAGQACGAVLVGSFLGSLNAYLAGTPGAIHHVGYGMLGRAAFGLYGSYMAVCLSCFESFIFYGINMVYGGQAIIVCLSAIIPQFKNMKNTLPESAGIDTQTLVGLILFIIVYFPVVAYVKPYKLQKLLNPALVIIIVTFLGMLGWAIKSNGGSPGNLVAPAIQISKYEAGFRFVQGITSVAGTYTGGSNRVSDWTRFAKTKHSPTPAMLTALPITVTLTGLIGILITSATYEYYGTLIWNPMLLLSYAQNESYTAACRAGTFFAGLGLVSTTLFINLTQNTVSSGMDMATLFPKYLTWRRGALIFITLGIVVNPWRFVSQAGTFIVVLSSFGVFMAPLAGILMCDYWLVRHGRWNIPDLYRAHGIYWFNGGLNWKAFVAFFLAVFPSMPGFVASTSGYVVSDGWIHVFQLNYFVGYISAGGIFYGLNALMPPKGLGEQVNMELATEVIEVEADGIDLEEKGPRNLKIEED